LLPDAPVPDSRTVLTNPDTTGIEAVNGDRAHLAPFIPVTNPLERSLGEVKRRTKVIAASPARRAASPSSGPYSTPPSPTNATASD
jgi:hypothetical protein